MAFELPKLNYAFEALEPNIDAKTMEIHYGKHHNGYTNNLNNIISGSENENKDIEEILNSLDLDNSGLRNNAGGYYNHNLFWEIMGPNCGEEPKSEISESINSNFGSFENFKDEFSKAAATRFGSGWAWLCSKGNGKLEICSTANQDNPLMPNGCGGNPILCLDAVSYTHLRAHET